VSPVVDALKIDRSFISQLAEKPEDETLLRTLVQLGKALSIETLADGIERQHELALLQEERCASGQGFQFAPPLAVNAAEILLTNWRPDDIEGSAPEQASEPAKPVEVPPGSTPRRPRPNDGSSGCSRPAGRAARLRSQRSPCGPSELRPPPVAPRSTGRDVRPRISSAYVADRRSSA
jgi:hypothetical protein